jgi:hypothetical protein
MLNVDLSLPGVKIPYFQKGTLVCTFQLRTSGEPQSPTGGHYESVPGTDAMGSYTGVQEQIWVPTFDKALKPTVSPVNELLDPITGEPTGLLFPNGLLPKSLIADQSPDEAGEKK